MLRSLLVAVGMILAVTAAVVVGRATVARVSCEPSWHCQDALARRRDAITAGALAHDGLGRARAREARRLADADISRFCPQGS